LRVYGYMGTEVLEYKDILAYGGFARNTSGSQNFAVLPKLYDKGWRFESEYRFSKCAGLFVTV